MPGNGRCAAATQWPRLAASAYCFLRCAAAALRVGVELDRHRRFGKLHRGDVHQVAPQHQSLPVALDHVHGVARRVPVRRDRRDAGIRSVLPLNGLNLPAATYGLIDAIAPSKTGLASFGAASMLALLNQKSASRWSARTIAFGNATLLPRPALRRDRRACA